MSTAPVWFHWKSFSVLPASSEMIKKSPWKQETKNTTLYCFVLFLLQLYSDLLIKRLTLPENRPIYINPIHCRCLLLHETELSYFVLSRIITYGMTEAFFYLVFFCPRSAKLLLGHQGVKNTFKKKKRKIAFPLRGAAGDPGALSLLIRCLENSRKTAKTFLGHWLWAFAPMTVVDCCSNYPQQPKNEKQHNVAKLRPFLIWNIHSNCNHMRKQRQTQQYLLVCWLRTLGSKAFCFARSESEMEKNGKKNPKCVLLYLSTKYSAIGILLKNSPTEWIHIIEKNLRLHSNMQPLNILV